MIRACVDANVLISYLLNPAAQRAPSRIIQAGVSQAFDLVVIETTLEEVARSVRTKPYLRTRIDPQNAVRLGSALRMAAMIVPAWISDVPQVTRDPGNDYLVAHAILLEVDVLITGDRDLLVLHEFQGVRIVSPAAFALLLDHLE